MQDLRFACRQLLKTPGFTLVVILSLAFGIGANATVLCWLRAVVLNPLPGVAHSEEMVVIVSNQGGGNASLPDLRDIATMREVFAGTLAHMPTPACLTVERQPEWLQAQIVTANFFELLGVQPLLGRTFLPEEDQKPGGNPVLLISEQLWRRRFGADPAVLGQVVDLNRHSFTIVGVVPDSFPGTLAPASFDVWAPASMIWEVRNQGTGFLTSRSARGWLNLARLQPGVTLEQARAAITTFDARMAREYPTTNGYAHHQVLPLSETPWGTPTVMAPALWLLLAVSGGVLLIVWANVANLLLARAMSRQKEIAIRLASGASRARIVRQLLTESVLLAALGGGLGVLMASWATDAAPLFLPEDLARAAQLHFPLDPGTLALTVLLTLGTALAFGLFPALQATRPDLFTVLKEGGRSSSGGGAVHHRLRAALVIAEVAIALALLISAGLCVKGLRQAQRIDIGFEPDHVLTADFRIGMNGYTRETGPAFYRQARERVAALPGVEEAAWASWFPLGLSGCKGSGVFVEGYERPEGEDTTYELVIVSPRYFAAMRIPLLAGRDFTDRDDASAPVAIVNEAFAQRFWPGQDPLGRRFRSNSTWVTIVGVAKTGKYNRLQETARPFYYLPYQQGVPDLDLALCVRTAADPAGFTSTLRRTFRELDPGVEMLQAMPLAAYSSMVLFPHRLASALLVFLGSVALLLAAMGVYAVIAYGVAQRTQEFGVRMALGAKPGNVIWQVLRHGLGLALLGTLAGLVLAVGVTQALTSFLYGVSPFDAVTFLIVSLLLIAVAALACWVPALRATRVDPIVALRSE
ncbi:ABC transporter permease [Opitutus terrae]|uniref:Permease n=1 Tax=Opitutus terrae (strain DSM 11246 / JCM 15787 / PB90-1) TaxID=452637 RepID=B1ZYP0_OPITP|nr:ABC transporter permease [Opitutus terrae]ACB75276.1 permease [Opitutus terrae PB90-1]